MTVSTTNNNVVYRGNGSTTQWTVPFKVLDVDHLAVTRRVYATGALDHTYVGTEFTYSGLGASSGTLTLDGAALSSTYELVIDRRVPYTQPLDIVNAGGFYPDTVEEQLDLIAMGLQQLADLVDRTPKAGVDDPGLVIPPAHTLTGSNRVLGTDSITGQLTLLPGSSFKGDPGGNVQAIGLFTAANGMTISAGTTRVCTSGYDTTGIGSAWYYYNPGFDLVTDPRAGFTAADGRIFSLDRFGYSISPFAFGVAGLVADDTIALQAFFDYCARYLVYMPWLSGSCQVSEVVTYGVNVNNPVTTVFYGSHFVMQNVSGTEMPYLLHIKCKSTHIYAKMRGLGGVAEGNYSQRQSVGSFIWFEDCRESVLHYVTAIGFLYSGIDTDPTASNDNNNNAIRIGTFVADGIGSGDTEDTTQSLISDFTLTGHSGSGSDHGQRSSFTVPLAQLPPADIASAFNRSVASCGIMVRLGTHAQVGGASRGRLHQVTSIDWATGVVNVHPWVDPAVCAVSATVKGTWIWGGAIRITGDDANYWRIDSMQCQRTGLALAIECGQGPVVSRFVLQNQCGVGIAIGRTAISDDELTGNGTFITGSYFEDVYDQVINRSRFDDLRNSGFIAAEYTLDLSKVHAIQSARAGTTGAVGALDDESFQNWEFRNNQIRLKYRGEPVQSTTVQDFDEYEVITYTGDDTVTIRLDQGVHLLRLFNRKKCLFVVKGTGATSNYAPTSVTFNVPSGSTLNGTLDGTYALSSFTGPAQFQVDFTAEDVCRIAVMTGKLGLFTTVTHNWPSLAAGASQFQNFTWAEAKIGDNVLVTYNGDILDTAVQGTVNVDGTVRVRHTNPTAGAVDLPEATMTIRLIR